MIFSAPYLLLHYTDETVTQPGTLLPGHLTDASTLISIRSKKTGLTEEFSFFCRQQTPRPLQKIEVVYPFAAGICTSLLRFYQNGFSTNCVAGASSYAAREAREGKDVCCFFYPAAGNTPPLHFSCAFSSALRLFTAFHFDDGGLRLTYYLENKPIEGELQLESMLVSTQMPGPDFLDCYAGLMQERYTAGQKFPSFSGYCSWSTLYKNTTGEKLEKAMDAIVSFPGATLFQIDDGWQTENSFTGLWQPDQGKIPDINALFTRAKGMGLTPGLWLAPFIAAESSGFLKENPQLTAPACPGEPLHSYLFTEEPVFPLRLAHPQMLAHLREVFTRLKSYGARYFKLDFCQFALLRLFSREQIVPGTQGYIVEDYRRALQEIRQAVGEETFLLACGAPIAEGLGLFNGIRVGPDITWGKNKNHPSAWQLIKMVARTTMQRAFYHGKMFSIDADGLVVRDVDQNDGHDITYNEAKTLATVIALSGGASLLNEQADLLSPGRRALYSRILPPLGLAARPVDMFAEQPELSKIQLENGVLAGIYNWEDNISDKTVPLSVFGLQKAFAFHCWQGRFEGLCTELHLPGMMPHSAEIYCLQAVPSAPCLLFADNNVFAGQGAVFATTQADGLTLSPAPGFAGGHNVWVFLPAGLSFSGSTPVCALPEGSVYQFFIQEETFLPYA